LPGPHLSGSDQYQAQRWVLLRTAPDQLTAELWRGFLEAEDIPAMLAPEDVVSYLGVTSVPCRLLVPESWLPMARLALDGELWASKSDNEATDA
jgi:hypothetical protein